MILILSLHSDHSTNYVIDWLYRLEKEFIRINYPSDKVEIVYQDLDKTILSINDRIIDSSLITSFWYRKGDLNLFIEDFGNDKERFFQLLQKHLAKEKETLEHFLHYTLSKLPHITSKFSVDVNKLEVLSKAQNIGIKVPPTAILSKKEDLQNFISIHGEAISKPLSTPFSFRLESHHYMTFTESINNENIDKIPTTFFSSLVQQKIEKKLEIRAFYLNGTFHSMAIHSQQIEQTSTDFRKYSYQYPNRTVPFQVPKELEAKLKKLMDELGLTTGSIDLIYSLDKEFYFLEVNPVGQFGMVSYPCNYYIEEIIANTL